MGEPKGGGLGLIGRAYAIKVIPTAAVLFAVMFSASLSQLWTGRSAAAVVFYSVLPGLLWGFYQEPTYGGLLQTEVVRRTSPALGILISNAGQRNVTV